MIRPVAITNSDQSVGKTIMGKCALLNFIHTISMVAQGLVMEHFNLRIRNILAFSMQSKTFNETLVDTIKYAAIFPKLMTL